MSTLLRFMLQFRFLTIWAVTSWFTFSLITWVSNFTVIGWYWAQPAIGVGAKAWFMLTMYASLVSNHTLLSAGLLLLIALLTGLNVALLDRYIRTRRGGRWSRPVGVWSLAGMVSGFFGIGCASCGSVILASLLGLVGAGSLVFLLPLHGLEFTLLAVGLLSYGCVRLWRRVNDPLVCNVK